MDNDLTKHPPRRWNDTFEGIAWLPRLIDKARAYDAGTLGTYLFGQSPADNSFLAAAGISYDDLLSATRLASDDAGAPLARLARWLGVLLDEQGELAAGLRLLERSLAICRDLGDRDQQARTLNSLGVTHRHLGNLDTARSLFEESIIIARELGGPPGSPCGS